MHILILLSIVFVVVHCFNSLVKPNTIFQTLKFLTNLLLKRLLTTQSCLCPLQPLGRLGANVTGIDPVEDSICTAQLHASYDPDLHDGVAYRACTLEELSAEGEEEHGAGLFDAVVASEVVEHLADLETFAFCCSHVLKVCVPRWCCVFFLPAVSSCQIFLHQYSTCLYLRLSVR